eukprot:m.116911 g.116911  ORF g.116911 m.116911 type:complete len:61 (+) comp15525_c1_seq2:48-230(+)
MHHGDNMGRRAESLQAVDERLILKTLQPAASRRFNAEVVISPSRCSEAIFFTSTAWQASC